jgi:uncharacterized membrane protein YidH (DUF202 family)
VGQGRPGGRRPTVDGEETPAMTDHRCDDTQVNPYQSPQSDTPARKSARDLMAILVSFLVISVLGCAFIFAYWMNFSQFVGVVRCVGFVAIMGGMHFIGFRLWRRQQGAEEAKTPSPHKSIWVRTARGVFLFALLSAVLFLLLSLLMSI